MSAHPPYALSGVARAGVTRANTHTSHVCVIINGIQRAYGKTTPADKILTQDLVITESVNHAPSRVTLTAMGFDIAVGMDVVVTLGSINNLDRLFAGQVLQLQQTALLTQFAHRVFQVQAIDYTWGLSTRKVSERYTATTVAAIVADLVATYAPNYTVHVQTGFDPIDEITFTNQDLPDCLTQLVKRAGGYWLCDYFRVVQVFLTDDRGTAPTAITDTAPSLLTQFAVTRDLSQWITRVYVEGGGANAATDLAPGETSIPVEDGTWYQAAGGTVVSGPQRITYTGRTLGGGGGLVGPGASPSAAAALALVSGTGIETGAHTYATTFVTGAGESLPSPGAALAVGALGAPSTAPTAGTPAIGSGPDPGSHEYAVTYVTSTGETTAGPRSAVTTTVVDPPASALTAGPEVAGGNLPGTNHFNYLVTFTTAAGETTPGPASNDFATGFNTGGAIQLSGIPLGPPGVTGRKIYRQVNVNPYALALTIPNNSATTATDSVYSTDPQPPTTNTASRQQVPLSAIPTGGALVTSRKVYRTAAGGSQLKLLVTIADNTTTTFTDTVTDASLGANVPTSNTATANQVALSGIPIGAAAVTSRKVYRTVATGSQLKLLATIADNTTTTYADSTADASLGANAPTTDASGLTQPAGQVLAGTTSLIVAGTAAFAAGGGWAIIGNGQQVIQYSGLSATALTGIPATGAGAIVASVSYNSTVTAAPTLTGIPASGPGAIRYPIIKGDPVNLWVTVDAAAQTALAAAIGGDGIQEDYLQDRRLSFTEATARGQAQLTLLGQVSTTVDYTTRDLNTRAGRAVTFNIGMPTDLHETLTIHQVSIRNFHHLKYPDVVATASSERVSFEDLLRQIKQRQDV